MKGTILRCLQGWVETQHGEAAWERAVDAAGARGPDGGAPRLAPQVNVPDEMALALFEATASSLGLVRSEMFDGFGHWWATEYGPRLYPSAYEEEDLIVFLARVNEIHRRVTEETHGRPPVLELGWASPERLTVSYRSARGLVDAAAGLLRGHLQRFGVEGEVVVQSATRLEILFAEAMEDAPSLMPPSRGSRVLRRTA